MQVQWHRLIQVHFYKGMQLYAYKPMRVQADNPWRVYPCKGKPLYAYRGIRGYGGVLYSSMTPKDLHYEKLGSIING